MAKSHVTAEDLFRGESRSMPLARRLRPSTVADYVGQGHIMADGKLLRRAIEADRLFSMILYGPPGSGKTSLGYAIAGTISSALIMLNAVEAGVGDLRRAIGRARLHPSGKTLLFIDEVHRFNKAQQDVLLAPLEDDVVTMIGSTVENPFFYLNSALLSRVTVFELSRLRDDDVRTILTKALSDSELGLGDYSIDVRPDALTYLVENSLGDARKALSALELSVLSTSPDRNGVIRITPDTAAECLQKRLMRYDRDGDSHYDIASAFIKSIRGSQPDAALHWMARMIAGGEDPRFIARRMIISASEDVGLADPDALGVAVAASRAVETVGMPEAKFALSEAAIYLATAPKSRTCADAIGRAIEDVERGEDAEVPACLRDASYPGAAKLGRGEGYHMPRSEADGRSQTYVPGGRVYYRPGAAGQEKEIGERLGRWDGARGGSGEDGGRAESGENAEPE